MAGKKGKSGRHPLHVERSFYELLDRHLPGAIAYCARIVRKAQKKAELAEGLERETSNPLQKSVLLKDALDWEKLGLEAAGKLLAKAPERQEASVASAIVKTYDPEIVIKRLADIVARVIELRSKREGDGKDEVLARLAVPLREDTGL